MTRWMRAACAAAVIAVVSAGAVEAAPKVNRTLFGGLAVKGYDPVAYFTESKAVKGVKAFEYEYMDAKWRFASAEHLALFKADPEKYRPQYGGYCAWAVSQGRTADIDPDAWKIVDGRLYLNYNAEIQKRWESNQDGFIREADRNWPAVVE